MVIMDPGDYKQESEKAKNRIKIADHMLNITYPMIKDTKLLIAVMDNLFLAVANSTTAILMFERYYKRVPLFPNNFDAKFEILRAHVAERYAISKETLQMLRNIKNLVLEHKKSPVEFSRRGEFVICTEDYQIRKLTIEDMKDYVNKAKVFINDVDRWISEDARNFR